MSRASHRRRYCQRHAQTVVKTMLFGPPLGFYDLSPCIAHVVGDVTYFVPERHDNTQVDVLREYREELAKVKAYLNLPPNQSSAAAATLAVERMRGIRP